jgi:hypothetical protein
MLALVIDWILSLLAVAAVTGRNAWEHSDAGLTNSYIAFGVMALEIWLLTCLVAGSAGQIVMRIAVRRVGGGILDPLRASIRTILMLLVIPPVIYNRDQRGLHDLATDSIAVRR